MQTAAKTPRIKFAVRVLAVILCLAIGLSGVVIPARADEISDAFDLISAQLASQGIASNIGDVTSSNWTAFPNLYFEKWTTVGDPTTAIGKIMFNSPLDFSDTATQTFLRNLGTKMEMGAGHIALDVSTSAEFQGIPASLVMYGLPLGITAEQLVVSDDNGNILVASGVVSNFSQAANGDVTFDAVHFTQFDIDTTAPAVTTFTVTTPSNSLNIPITAFTISDNISATGYLITTSSTPPAKGDTGWAGTAPTTYTVASNGSYTLYPWAKDAAGNVSAVFGSPRPVVVNTTSFQIYLPLVIR